MEASTSFKQRAAMLWRWLRWPIALLLLAWLWHQHRDDFRRLDEREIERPWLYLAFALCLGSILSTFVRWHLLVWAQGFSFRLSDAIRIGFLGYLFNYVSPGAVGGDLVKALFLAREQSSRRLMAVATVAVDRMLGLLALFIAGAAATLIPTELLSHPSMLAVVSTYRAASVAGIAGLLLVLSPLAVRSRPLLWLTRLPKIGPIFAQVVNALRLYADRWRVVAVVLLLSIAGHVAMLSAFYCCARAVNPVSGTPGFWEHFQFIPAAELAGVIVPLPGGVGALEGACAYFYGIAGAAEGDGFLTGLSYRFISLLIAGVGAICYATLRREIRSAMSHGTDSERDSSTTDSSAEPDADRSRSGVPKSSSL